jgi:hypothetical protein
VTENKALKRDVRRRMAKTGERYTTARKHVAAPDLPRTADPGMTDETIRRGSGRSWAEWFAILDAWGGRERTHRDIARHVAESYGVSGWWAQTVTVGYERARGLRAPNQRPDGFTVSVSKTYPVAADDLSAMFTDARKRRRWLEPGALRLRTSQPGRTARFDAADGVTRVNAWFTAKGTAKSSVALQIERLTDAKAVERARASWRERLARLGADLAAR